MKKLNLFILAAIFFTTLFSGCEKEEKNAANEAREALNKATDELVAYVNDFKNSDAINSMSMSGNIPLPIADETKKGIKNSQKIKQHVLNVFRPIIRKSGLRTKSDEVDHFVFQEHTGTYTWNFETELWDYVNTPADKIIVHFPAQKTDISNTATLTLHNIAFYDYNYSDEYGMYESSVITSVQLDLYISNEKQIDLTLDNEVDAEGFPVHTEFSLFFNPYQINAEITSTATNYSYNYTVVNGNETMFSGAVNYNGDFDENLGSIKGFQQAASLNVKFDINVKNILEEAGDDNEEPDFAAVINNNVDIAFYSYPEDIKIGDIEISTDKNEDVLVLIELADGSKENAIPYFERIADAIEQLANELETRYSFDYYAKK